MRISEMAEAGPAEKVIDEFPNSRWGAYASISLSEYTPLTVELISIQVKNDFRSQGIGTEMLEVLIELANKHQANIILWPAEDSDDPERLYGWYERLGFVLSKKVRGAMVYISPKTKGPVETGPPSPPK